MRLSRSKPLSRCVKGEPCKCNAVITLKVEDDIQLRQPDLYGTTAWKQQYSRRSGIESLNAETSTHRGKLRRGFTRVHGLTKTAILLTFAIVGINVRILYDWHENRGLTDPWSAFLDEPPDQRPRQKRPSTKRKPTFRERSEARAGPPGTTTRSS
jgi:hypothetical protein